MIVMGSMIGSGIFIVSASVAKQVGSPGFLLLTWVFTGILTIIAALSYGELAGMMPKAGGQYVYLREAFNPLIGFLFGWTTFLVIETGLHFGADGTMYYKPNGGTSILAYPDLQNTKNAERCQLNIMTFL